MASIVQTKRLSNQVRVAAVFEGGKIRPVWFEIPSPRSRENRERVATVNQTWHSQEGSALIINIAVTTNEGSNYVLSYNTRDIIWQARIVETSHLHSL